MSNLAQVKHFAYNSFGPAQFYFLSLRGWVRSVWARLIFLTLLGWSARPQWARFSLLIYLGIFGPALCGIGFWFVLFVQAL